MTAPPAVDAARCLDLRCRSKRGEYLRPEDHRFCQQMYATYPDWYAGLDDTVFMLTRPAGSTATPRRLREKE